MTLNKLQQLTTAIIHCGGISLRKFLPLYQRLVTAEWSSHAKARQVGQFHNETIAQPL